MVFSFQFIFSHLLNAISFSFINKFDSVENIFLILISVFSPTFHQSSLHFTTQTQHNAFHLPILPTSSGLISAIFFILRPSTHKFSSYKLLISTLSSEKLKFLVSEDSHELKTSGVWVILIFQSSTTIVVFNTQNGIKARTKLNREVIVEIYVISVIVVPPTHV